MRGHDLTNKKTMTKTNTNTNTNTKTMTMTKTNTFREHLQRATLETLSETALYLPLSLTDYKDRLLFDTTERPYRLVTFETFDQSDEET